MTDGIRMFEKLSINDVALTYVMLQNCIQICFLHEESSICDEIVCNNITDMESIKSSGLDKNIKCANIILLTITQPYFRIIARYVVEGRFKKEARKVYGSMWCGSI